MQRLRRDAGWGFGAPDAERLAAFERLLVPLRWGAVAVAGTNTALGHGAVTAVDWGVTATLLATNLAVLAVLRGGPDVPALRRVGIGVFAADAVAAVTAAFNNAAEADNVTFLVWVLILFEAALRWGHIGGLLSGVGAAVGVAALMLFRQEHYGLEIRDAATLAFRAGMMLAVGVMAGGTVRRMSDGSHSLDRQLRQSEALHRVAFDAPRLGVDEAARQIADTVLELGYERVAILLLDEAGRQLHVRASGGFTLESEALSGPVPVTRGITGRCIRTREPQVVPDVRADAHYLAIDPDTRSEMVIPLIVGERALGVLDIASTKLDAFDDDDVRFLSTLAGLLAQALDTARLGARERETIDELRTLNTLKDDFVAIASHELRTPLTSIRGFVKTILGRELSPEQTKEFLAGIERQTERLSDLVEDLLAVSLIEGGRATPTLEVVDLAGFLADTVHDLALTAPDRTVTVSASPDIKVHADVSFLRRVVVNLVTNAIRYSPDGSPVRVAAAIDPPAGVAWVGVSDHGVGIDPDDVGDLFGKFSRPRGPGRPQGGTGLGLFIVKGLVEAMGGEVTVDSVPGRGSTFAFTIPLARNGAVA